MTPRTLFIIILKIFGIWLITGLIQVIPQVLSLIPLFFSANINSLAPIATIVFFVLVLYAFVIYVLLFRTGYLVDKLSLEKDFGSQTIDITLQQTTVIQIAIIVLGGIIFINALPGLFELVASYVRLNHYEGNFLTNPELGSLLLQAGKLVVGFLFMNNSRRLTGWIERRSD